MKNVSMALISLVAFFERVHDSTLFYDNRRNQKCPKLRYTYEWLKKKEKIIQNQKSN